MKCCSSVSLFSGMPDLRISLQCGLVQERRALVGIYSGIVRVRVRSVGDRVRCMCE